MVVNMSAIEDRLVAFFDRHHWIEVPSGKIVCGCDRQVKANFEGHLARALIDEGFTKTEFGVRFVRNDVPDVPADQWKILAATSAYPDRASAEAAVAKDPERCSLVTRVGPRDPWEPVA
jgi:hypothetical protein